LSKGQIETSLCLRPHLRTSLALLGTLQKFEARAYLILKESLELSGVLIDLRAF
jgi:hypothetical protein